MAAPPLPALSLGRNLAAVSPAPRRTEPDPSFRDSLIKWCIREHLQKAGATGRGGGCCRMPEARPVAPASSAVLGRTSDFLRGESCLSPRRHEEFAVLGPAWTSLDFLRGESCITFPSSAPTPPKVYHF